MLRCGSKNQHQNGHVLKRDWSMHSKHADYYKLNTQHDWGDLYNSSASTKTFTLL